MSDRAYRISFALGLAILAAAIIYTNYDVKLNNYHILCQAHVQSACEHLK